MLITELMITEQCNLACTYCYMKNNNKYMKKETIDLYLDKIENILKLYKQDKYHISFFGGEPLLNWELIEYAVPKFNKDPRCHSMVIISNGLLLDEKKCSFIKKNNLGFSLSFDGLWQKDNRPLVSGKSSFEEYIKKKPLIHELAHTSKCMISPHNIEGLVDNHIFLTQEYDFTTPDFSLVRDDIWSDEDVKKFDENLKKLADYCIERIRKGYQEFNGIFGLYILDMLIGHEFGKRSWGCFAGKNGVGYNSEGIFYPCARFASSEEYKIYDAQKELWYKSNITHLLQPKISNPKVYPECKSCDIYQYCNAGCTYSQLKNGKEKASVPIKNLCDILKICYRESIRITVELKGNSLFNNIVKNMLKNSG